MQENKCGKYVLSKIKRLTFPLHNFLKSKTNLLGMVIIQKHTQFERHVT